MRPRSRRVARNTAVGAAVAVGGWAIHAAADPAVPGLGLSLATGYLGLALTGVTLVLGPLNVLRGRPNPVSTQVRRDVGIWAALVSGVHVVVGLQRHFGGDLVEYFFASAGRLPVRLDLFGLANWVGLAATVVLAGLLALSNDVVLRRLAPRRWKRLQRWNYTVLPATLAHAAAYQALEDRTLPWVVGGVALGAAVLAFQLLGFARVRAAP